MNYHSKIIKFFKKHNIYDQQMFNYFSNHSTLIDYETEEKGYRVGHEIILNKRNYIIGLNLYTPYVTNDLEALSTIHELIHATETYQKFGTRYKEEITLEALPMLYEKIFLLENPSQELTEYCRHLDNVAKESKNPMYLFGLTVRDELLSSYNGNFLDMQRETKRLSKKYKIN